MKPAASYLNHIAGEAVALFFHGAPEREVHLTPTGWLAMSGTPLADFNVVLVDQGAHAAEQLQTFQQRLQARNLPALFCFTAAVAEPLAATAQTLGMQAAGKIPLMVRQASEIRSAATSYTITQVAGAAELAQVSQVIAGAFSLPSALVMRALGETLLDAPGLAVFLAHAAGQPISTVTTIQSGPIVGVWAMGTLPAQQRHGAGRNLLAHVMAEHQARGARWFYLWATTAGKPLYERVGFHTEAELSVWVTGHSTQVSGH